MAFDDPINEGYTGGHLFGGRKDDNEEEEGGSNEEDDSNEMMNRQEKRNVYKRWAFDIIKHPDRWNVVQDFGFRITFQTGILLVGVNIIDTQEYWTSLTSKLDLRDHFEVSEPVPAISRKVKPERKEKEKKTLDEKDISMWPPIEAFQKGFRDVVEQTMDVWYNSLSDQMDTIERYHEDRLFED